jgi:hypothetical protein
MGPATSLLASMLEESELLSSHTALADPSLSRILAFGKAVDAENKGSRLIDAVAFAMGPVGADLGVAGVTGSWVDLCGGGGKHKILVPRILVGESGADVGYSFQSPIRQVRSAASVGEGGGRLFYPLFPLGWRSGD